MAVKQEFRFPSADGSTSLYGCTWAPEQQPPKAVVQLVHGISEHSGRYDDLAAFLADRGWLVAAEDHLGHGQTPQKPEDLGFTADVDGWIKMTENVKAFRDWMGRQYPDLPYLMMGHSMGSFLARSYLIRYPSTITACILSGTGQVPQLVLTGGLTACAIERARLGNRKYSPLLNLLGFGAYNSQFKPARTPYDWISSSEEEVDRYMADPYCLGKASTVLMTDTLRLVRFNQRKQHLAQMDPTTPILFLSGQNDPVGDNGEGVTRAYQSFLAAGCSDVTLKLIPGARHEAHHEVNKEEVWELIHNWLVSKLP